MPVSDRDRAALQNDARGQQPALAGYSITLLARARSIGGMVRPSAFDLEVDHQFEGGRLFDRESCWTLQIVDIFDALYLKLKAERSCCIASGAGYATCCRIASARQERHTPKRWHRLLEQFHPLRVSRRV
jgi:hypothetical protein